MMSVHPFPARMAPELALESLRSMESGVVLDPMSGSGTVARMAKDRGLTALGYDLDPLAVLISTVGTTPINDDLLNSCCSALLDNLDRLDPRELKLPWIDEDPEAQKFVEFWFGEDQRRDLRKLAFVLSEESPFGWPEDVRNFFKLALSRIIVTKKQTASLAQDTSHSRPHRVVTESRYDVIEGYRRSLSTLRRRVAGIPKSGTAIIRLGDARNLNDLRDESIDLVLTSPPYLNAIDYMRGHRLSLIWLGHRYRDLSYTRSNSIGSERRPDVQIRSESVSSIKGSMGDLSSLQSKFHGMIERYILDLAKVVGEVSRVLRQGSTATFVMGNSCLKDVYIENSAALEQLCQLSGLKIKSKSERELPSGNRYLPTPSSGALSKRMRKEVILSFCRV